MVDMKDGYDEGFDFDGRPWRIWKNNSSNKNCRCPKSERDLSVGGMISREVRKDYVGVSFQILDLTSGKQGWLAQINGSRSTSGQVLRKP